MITFYDDFLHFLIIILWCMICMMYIALNVWKKTNNKEIIYTVIQNLYKSWKFHCIWDTGCLALNSLYTSCESNSSWCLNFHLTSPSYLFRCFLLFTADYFKLMWYAKHSQIYKYTYIYIYWWLKYEIR